MADLETWIVTLDDTHNDTESGESGYLIKTGQNRPWELMTGAIEGLTPEQGKFYKIVLEKQKIPNPPAGGSSINWKLIQIIDGNVEVNTEEIGIGKQQK